AVPNVVGGEVGRGLEIDADEIADGVVVLGPVEPPDRHPPGVFGPVAVGFVNDDVKPAVDLLHIGGGGLLRPGGRHLAGTEGVADLLPGSEVLEDGGVVPVAIERHPALGPGRGMAAQTVFADERGDVTGVLWAVARWRGGKGRRNHPDTQTQRRKKTESKERKRKKTSKSLLPLHLFLSSLCLGVWVVHFCFPSKSDHLDAAGDLVGWDQVALARAGADL